MKILLLGRSGQVGWELQRSLSVLGELIALDRNSSNYCGDLTQPQALAETVRALQPQVIVNAAAYTAVDKAESEPDMARMVNAVAPAVLAHEAHGLGAWLVHYSTDYVFNGSGGQPWVESDEPGPLNIYGHTKLEGERAIRAGCERHLILRTSWVYGARGNNFAKTMLRLAKEREELNVVDDQIGAPTGADLLADVTALALRELQRQPERAGLYHLCADGYTSWHGYARHVVDRARQFKPELQLSVREIKAVASSAFQTAATRPRNSRLDNSRIQKVFGLRLPPWQQGVDRMLQEIL